MQFGRSSRFGTAQADRHGSNRISQHRDQHGDQPTRLDSVQSSRSANSGVRSHTSSSVLHRSSSAPATDGTAGAGSCEHALDLRSADKRTSQDRRSPQFRSPWQLPQQDPSVPLSQQSPIRGTPASARAVSPVLFRARAPPPPLSLVAPWRGTFPPTSTHNRPSSQGEPSREYSCNSSTSQVLDSHQGRRRRASACVNASCASSAARRGANVSSASSRHALGAASARSDATVGGAWSSRPAVHSVRRGTPTSATGRDHVAIHRRGARPLPTPRVSSQPSPSRRSPSHRACAPPALWPSQGGSYLVAESDATDGYGAGALPHSSKPTRRKPPRPRPIEHPPEILDLTGGLLQELLLLETLSLPLAPVRYGHRDGPLQARASARHASTSRAQPKMGGEYGAVGTAISPWQMRMEGAMWA